MLIPLTDIFRSHRPLVGILHLLPLPGSPRWGGSMDAILERAAADAKALEAAGLDGLLVENYNDAPFYPEDSPVRDRRGAGGGVRGRLNGRRGCRWG